MSEPTKYTLYEVLEMMIERTSWNSEQTKLDALETVRAAKANNALGIITQMLACNHPEEERQAKVIPGYYSRLTQVYCGLCGRIMS